ncbi:MAG: hypothetical protein AAGM22_28925 [Acidobacteriota bacterium]
MAPHPCGKLFDRFGGDDLLIGVQADDHETIGVTDAKAGLAITVQNALFFADGFESGDFAAWSAPPPARP